jgi:ParB family chromosome partitioning protein
MNLREKCYVALNVIRMYLEEEPTMAENDARILDSIEQGHYLTVGLTYEKNVRFSGSSFESLLKKVDFFMDKPLKQAIEERKRRSGILLELHDLTTACVAALKKIGLTHPFIYKEVVSFANPHKRKRKVSDTFDGLFEKVKHSMKELLEDPGLMRKHKFSVAAE